MTKLTKHHTQIKQFRSYYVGLLLALIMALSPTVAQADILQETFGKGYDFLTSHTATRPLETPKRQEHTTQATIHQKTFGEGYAFVDQKPSRSIVATKTLPMIDVTIKNSEIHPKEPRISAFHSLMSDGYGVTVRSSQVRFSN